MPIDELVEEQPVGDNELSAEEGQQEQKSAPPPEVEELKTKLETLEQELINLRKVAQQPEQTPQAPDVHAELAKLKLAQYLANDPYASKYREEIEAAIASVSPEYRISDFTIRSAIDYVKGKHVDEIVASVKREAPAPVESSSRAPEPQKPEPPKLVLSEPQKVVLSAWFDGDTEAALKLVETTS